MTAARREIELWQIAEQVCTQRQLEVCRLLWLRELSYRQAATMLRIAPATVQTHERAARRRITAHLEQRKAA